jgi:hypothetical protein
MTRLIAALACLFLVACVSADPGADPTAISTADPTGGIDAPPDPGEGFGAPDDVGTLVAYGQQHAGEFGGLYIDQAAGGRVVLLFTANVAVHARAIEALAPGVDSEVRSCRYTEAELIDLVEGLDMDALRRDGYEVIGAGVDTINNVVTIDARSNLEAAKERLEAQFDGRVVANISPVPGPWQNVEAGDAWRLLAAGRTNGSEAYTTRAAVDETGWMVLWQEVGLGGEPPEPDLANEIVLSFGIGIGSSCPEVRLDDVVIDADGRVVHALTSDPLAPRACTSDLVGTVAFVVAVERSAVPASPFQARLGPDDVAWSEPVEVDIRP